MGWWCFIACEVVIALSDVHGSGSPIIALDLVYQLHYGVGEFSCIGVDGGVGPYQLGFAVHGLMIDQIHCFPGCTSA